MPGIARYGRRLTTGILCLLGGALSAAEPPVGTPPAEVFTEPAGGDVVEPTFFQEPQPLTPATPLRPNTAPPAGPQTLNNAPRNLPGVGSRYAQRGRYTPAMIGDYLGAGGGLQTVYVPPSIPAATGNGSSSSGGSLGFDAPSSGGAGPVVGRLKIAENGVVMPGNRVFFNYSHFDGVDLFPGKVDVNRFIPGFEHAFFDGQASVELRVPFAFTVDNELFVGGGTNVNTAEMGNVVVNTKAVVYSDDDLAVAAGLGFSIPTASDTRVYFPGFEAVRIENESVHLMPFLAAAYTPNDQFFMQSFLQIDVDTNGNPVLVDPGTGLARAGSINDPTFLYYDLSAGYWIVRSDDPSESVTGIAPVAELHYNRSLNTPDFVSSAGYGVGTGSSEIELINALIGVHLEFYQNTRLTFAYVTPIAGGADKQFDGELRALLNVRLGAPQSRASRVW